MSKLLLDKDLHEESADYAAARVTARLQTVAVLERLDAGRKRTVLLFLREAQLIHRINRLDPNTTTKPKVLFHAHYVGLRDADLSGANLREAHLLSTSGDYPISLKGANLKNAKFCKAILRGADLSGADLRGADLHEADLHEADLREAMRVTNEKLEHMGGLSGADLHGEGLLRVKLNGADLRGAKHLTQGQLELAIGDNETKLSSYLKPPTHWGVKVDEQSKGG
jgi:Pentapeptide repeats (8 copies)